ncbi:MAG: enoyl-CoA hydratase/isomerase family protein [Novosphingobium sp.]
MRSQESVTQDVQATTAVIRFASDPCGTITNKGAGMLADAVEAVLADPAIRTVVLTGAAPGVFIRHADVGQIARAAQALADGRTSPEAFLSAPFQRLGALLDGARKPVIAAINGVCMGGGFEIALACTMRVAGAEVAAIGLPEIRIDIFPGAGGTQRLARLIGRHRARLFMLAGAVVDARQAAAAGLVDEVATDPLVRALELAADFAQRSPDAVAAIMALTAADDAAGLQDEALAFAAVLGAPGVQARLERFVADGDALDRLA